MGAAQPTRAAVALAAEGDYSSFFGDDALRGSGWAACPEPVTWSVDMGRLSPAAAKREMARLRTALGLWSRDSGVPLEFTGRQPLVYDNTSYQLRAADNSAPRTRHIYIGFYGGKEVSGLSGNVVGLARPTSMLAREVVSGMAVFRRGYVLREQSEEPRHLTTGHLIVGLVGIRLGDSDFLHPARTLAGPRRDRGLVIESTRLRCRRASRHGPQELRHLRPGHTTFGAVGNRRGDAEFKHAQHVAVEVPLR